MVCSYNNEIHEKLSHLGYGMEGNTPSSLYWVVHAILINCISSGKGAVRLADAVLKAVEEPVDFKFLYDVKVFIARAILVFT